MMKKNKNIFLMRHGRTEWNKNKRLQGRQNSPLLESSHDEILQTLKLLPVEEIDFVFASPLGRVIETIEIMQSKWKFVYEKNSLLMECDMGLCEGFMLEEVIRKHEAFWRKREQDKWNTPWPNGESYADIYLRASRFVEELPNEKNILILSHEMMGKCIAGTLCNWSPEKIIEIKQTNTQIFRISDNEFTIME